MPRSDHEKAEIRRQTEARREQAKDRAAHEAKRGVKSESPLPLSHLSRSALRTDEFPAALAMLHAESDRGAAVMGAALIEEAFTEAIETRLVNKVDRAALFHDHGAPFGTMRAKTVAAHGLGLIGPNIADRTDKIRTIRNQFSHSLRPINFDTEQISLAIQPLRYYTEKAMGDFYNRFEINNRICYIFSCLWTTVSISIGTSVIEQKSIEPLQELKDILLKQLFTTFNTKSGHIGERDNNIYSATSTDKFGIK